MGDKNRIDKKEEYRHMHQKRHENIEKDKNRLMDKKSIMRQYDIEILEKKKEKHPEIEKAEKRRQYEKERNRQQQYEKERNRQEQNEKERNRHQQNEKERNREQQHEKERNRQQQYEKERNREQPVDNAAKHSKVDVAKESRQSQTDHVERDQKRMSISAKRRRHHSHRPQLRQSFVQKDLSSVFSHAGDIYVLRTDEELNGTTYYGENFKKEFLEMFDFEPKSNYRLLDKVGHNILFGGENVSQKLNIRASVRPFKIYLVDKNKEHLITLERPCQLKHFWNICQQRISVYFPPKNRIGDVLQIRSFLSPKFHIQDISGKNLYKISIIEDENSVWEIWSSNTKFQIKDIDSHKMVGKIIKTKVKEPKKLKGYRVSFLKQLDIRVKILILGASFLIECMYFGK